MLARLVRDADAPFYIHCHHGRHRGPAAAAIACIASGTADGKNAVKILERAGTSRGYAGLWRDVEHYTPPPIGERLPELVEVARIDSMAAAMVQIDRSLDALKQCHAANWTVPKDHPDVVPTQQAVLIREGFREASRHLENPSDAELRQWLFDAEKSALGLLETLNDDPSESVATNLSALEDSCTKCHRKYRDQ